MATAPADDGSAAVDISAALQVGIPLSVGPVEDGSTAVHVSAVLQVGILLRIPAMGEN